MAMIVILDDYPHVIEALTAPLLLGGHKVYSEMPPIDFERILSVGPQVIVAGIARRKEALDRPIANFAEDVIGHQALEALGEYLALTSIPTVIVGIGLNEKDLPRHVHYDAFLTFPEELDLFVAKVGEVATLQKKRQISDYVCPHPGCGSRLVFHKRPIKDLFCPKCGTSVAFIDDEHCVWMSPDGEHHDARIQDLLAPGVEQRANGH